MTANTTRPAIAAKHAKRISVLFNTIAANNVMARPAPQIADGLKEVPYSYWVNSSIAAARELRDSYGIEVPGWTSQITD